MICAVRVGSRGPRKTGTRLGGTLELRAQPPSGVECVHHRYGVQLGEHGIENNRKSVQSQDFHLRKDQVDDGTERDEDWSAWARINSPKDGRSGGLDGNFDQVVHQTLGPNPCFRWSCSSEGP